MKYAKRVDQISGPGSDAWDVHSAAVGARARGEDVVIMSIGDPDFATPADISQAAVAALKGGDTHYTSCAGRPELRAAIAAAHQAASGMPTDASQVIALAGAQCGLFSVLQCLCGSGDEVIVPEPCYVTYPAAIGACGAHLVRTPAQRDNGFRPDIAALAAAITPRTRVILFASPNNPAGVMFDETELQAIAELALQHDLWVISDEVYARLVFTGMHRSIAALPGMAERTATVSSLSKSHAMTGWRVGWVIGPQALARHLENLALCMLYGLPGFIQQGALHALREGTAASEQMRRTYLRRRDLVVNALTGALGKQFCHLPAAGMFTLIDVRPTGMSSADFCRALFAAEKVSLLDASAFGDSLQGFARLSFTTDDASLSTGCERIVRFAHQL